MKHDKSLKIESLDSELFIEELGRVTGGTLTATTMALGEEDSPGGMPAPSQPKLPGPVTPFDPSAFQDQLNERLAHVRQLVNPWTKQPFYTTQALGEE